MINHRNKNKLKKDRNKTMTEQVYEKLENLIVFCEIEPGSILTEAEIAEIVGAGRTPVREALRLLSKRFLVNISRVGIVIPEMNSRVQLQLLEVRRVILKLCMECAVKRLTEIDKKNIQDLLDTIDEQDDVEFLHWLKKRQEVLAKCSKNEFIYEELRNAQGLSRRFWYYYAKKEDHLEVKKLHKLILQAVYDQNEKNALKYVDDMIDYIEEFVKRHYV
ncbi:MAG: GntR family transcriptional regulator [Campylobacterales bacterium]|nr:GntR family transcriptional regulator [Campylobacterales bacterium]NQY52007.1 GntR family transcriptional regulator [Campylobacteraceae bacterium]